MLNVDLSGFRILATNRRVTPLHRMLNHLTVLRPLRNRVLSAQAARLTASYDMFVLMAYAVPVHCSAPRGAILCQFPYRLQHASDLDGYQTIVCQSMYVRHWISDLWGRDAVVVNPPIDVPVEPPSWDRKRQIILSVGRFIRTGHSKRQDVMVEVFRQLVQGGLRGWELHLAGSVHRDAAHAGYLETVRELARGLPVHLHPDVSHAEIQDLYRGASIYWHAAGFGADPSAEPAALEHFGMTTAEAMAHGVVPVVYAGGGQTEVVRDGEDGVWWRELGELRTATLELVANQGLRHRLGERARESSTRFTRARFADAIVAALGPALEEAAAPLVRRRPSSP
jgi:glycosyltransferase involved in cell wall biosynthesis